MPAFIDLTARRFGRLTVLARWEQNDALGRPKWRCRCECGRETTFGQAASRLIVETSPEAAAAVDEAKSAAVERGLREVLIAREKTDQRIMRGLDSGDDVAQPEVQLNNTRRQKRAA